MNDTYSRFNNIRSINGTPLDLSGVTFREDRDFLTVNNELTILSFNSTLETTMNGIVLEHVNHVFQGDERIVDSNDLDFRVSERSTEDNTTNTTETKFMLDIRIQEHFVSNRIETYPLIPT